MDVTFDLRTDKYYPYRKDNNQLLYINKQSNHPPTIIKQISSMVKSAEEYLIYLVTKNTSIKLHPHIITHLNSVASMKIFHSRQHPRQEGIAMEQLFGSIHHIVSMWNPTSVEYFYVWLTSTSCDIITTASCSIETISRSAIVACQIWQVSSETITPVYWKILLQLT